MQNLNQYIFKDIYNYVNTNTHAKCYLKKKLYGGNDLQEASLVSRCAARLKVELRYDWVKLGLRR